MNQGFYALLGVIVGAVATMISNLLFESIKIRTTRRGAASAISASINATLELANERRYVERFTLVMKAAEAGTYLSTGNIATWRGKFLFDPVVDRYVDSFGIFPGRLSGEIT